MAHFFIPMGKSLLRGTSRQRCWERENSSGLTYLWWDRLTDKGPSWWFVLGSDLYIDVCANVRMQYTRPFAKKRVWRSVPVRCSFFLNNENSPWPSAPHSPPFWVQELLFELWPPSGVKLMINPLALALRRFSPLIGDAKPITDWCGKYLEFTCQKVNEKLSIVFCWGRLNFLRWVMSFSQ
jgi:hypothetical protein